MVYDYNKTDKIFSIISEVNEVLSVSNEPQQLLDMILDTLFEVLKIDCCWVQLFSLESRKLWLAAYRGFTPDMKREIGSTDLEHSFAHQVAGLGHKISISDLSRDREYGLSSLSKTGLRSLVVVPLATYRIQGLMGIASLSKTRFPAEVSKLLMVIAGLVGTALSKADLYQRTLARERQLSKDIQLIVESSLDKGVIHQGVVTKLKKAVDTDQAGVVEGIGQAEKTSEEPKEKGEALQRTSQGAIDPARYAFEKHNQSMIIFRKSHMTD